MSPDRSCPPRHRRTLVLLILLALPPLGCRQSSTSAPAQPAAASGESPSRAQSTSSAESARPADAATTHTTGEAPVDVAAAANNAPAAHADPGSGTGPAADPLPESLAHAGTAAAEQELVIEPPADPERDAAVHRLLVLLPEGPILCDVRLVTDGRALEQAIAELTRDVLSAGDVDGDGAVTWRELTTADAFKYGQWGNVRPQDEEQRKAVVYRCDVNRNDRVDADEVAALLAPSGAASSWIHVASASAANRATDGSSLFEWLDANHDQQLDGHEMKRAATRMRMLDREDDGILVTDELPGMTQAPMLEARMPDAVSGSRAQPLHVARLQGTSDWSRVLYLIEDRYAFGSPVQAVDLPLHEELFAAVDANRDGYWSVAEVPSLLELPADLALVVRFGAAGPTLKVDGARTHASGDASAANGDRLSLSLSGGELVVRASQAETSPESTVQTFWAQWDGNSDGSLDANEYPAAEAVLGLPLAAVDRNGDSRVESSEAVDLLRQRTRAQDARIQIDLTTESEPLWRRLDTSGDGRLSERELDDVVEGLRQLAASDGVLAANELQPTLVLHFRRGSGAPGPGAAAVVAATAPDNGAQRPDAESLPRWFVETDKNRDGEISRREFLGPPALLDEWDRNADGRLQPDELGGTPE